MFWVTAVYLGDLSSSAWFGLSPCDFGEAKLTKCAHSKQIVPEHVVHH